MRNNKIKKRYITAAISVMLAGCMVMTSGGVASGVTGIRSGSGYMTSEVHAEELKEDETADSDEDKKDEADEIKDFISDNLLGGSDEESDKEESVYVIADPDGTPGETIVTEWLKNPEGKSELKDESQLKDITNVKGDETFTEKGNQLTWNADGNDIYYQGNTDKETPVGVKVTYYLDDEKVKPEEIKGRTGHVKIKYEYQNTSKEGDVYTPFLMITGMIMDSDTFKNIKVTNGKVISDGARFIVVGYGLPGLADSLAATKKLDIPEGFEVEADASDFQLGMSVTVASTKGFLGDDGIDISDTKEKVSDLSTEYQSGMNALNNGINE